jgi:hypothetical protein
VAAFDALRALTEATVGVKLFTVMTFDPRTRMARASIPTCPTPIPYPAPSPPTRPTGRGCPAGEEDLRGQRHRGIAKVFDDHELIRSLGCESVMNVPIIVAGEVIGTINCLHEAGHYTPEKIQAAEALKLPGALCLLLQQRNSSSGDR